MSGRRLVAVTLMCGGVVAGSLASVDAQTQRDRQAPARDRTAAAATGTGVIAGVVMSADERPQPVRRVSVMLASGLVSVPRTAVTDDEGRFEFTGLAAGNYTLVAQKPAWVSAVYGSRGVGDQGIPIAVVDGQRVDVRFPIGRGAVLAGTVRYASGAPASGVSVQVQRVMLMAGQRQVTTAAAPAQADDQGSYRVFGLPAGDYVVQARSQASMSFNASGVTRQVTESEVRWGEQQLAQSKALAAASSEPVEAPAVGPTITYSVVYFPGTAFASDAAVVSLLAGKERAGVDFVMAPVPTGKVTGLVLNPDGSPAAGASVALDAEGGSAGDVFSLIAGGGRTATARDGRFTLSGVTPGQYTVTVRGTPRRAGAPEPSAEEAAFTQAMAMAGSLAGGMFGGATGNPATLWAVDAVGVNGRDVGPITVQLREGLTVEGTVVVEGGGAPQDVAALRIAIAKPASGDPLAAMMSRVMGAASTGAPDPQGAFVVRGLLPGKYVVAVSGKSMRHSTLVPGSPAAATGWVVKSIRWRDQDLADAGVEVLRDSAITGVVVTLTDKPSELSGTVIDVAGRPTGAFPIVVYTADRTFWGAGSRRVVQAQPASDGKFMVIGLPPGQYYMAAVTRLEPGDLENSQFLEDLVPAAIRLSLAEGQKKTQDLKLASGG